MDTSALRKVIQELVVPELSEIKAKLAAHDERFTSIDQRFALVDRRFDALESKMNDRFTSVEKRLDKLEHSMAEIHDDQILIIGKLDLDKRVTRIEALLEQRRP